jgi:hypothetical protein
MEPGLSSPATFRPLPERPSGRLTLLGMGTQRPCVKRRIVIPIAHAQRGLNFVQSYGYRFLTEASPPVLGCQSEEIQAHFNGRTERFVCAKRRDQSQRILSDESNIFMRVFTDDARA